MTTTLPDQTRQVLESTAPYVVINAGRQGGKTRLGAMWAAEKLMAGKSVLCVCEHPDNAIFAVTEQLRERGAKWQAVSKATIYVGGGQAVFHATSGRITFDGTTAITQRDVWLDLPHVPWGIGERAQAIAGEDHQILITTTCTDWLGSLRNRKHGLDEFTVNPLGRRS